MKTTKKKMLRELTDKEIDKAIRISGTQFDRKRKLTDKQIDRAKNLYHMEDCSFYEIGAIMNVDHRTIRYHLDPTYRRSRITQATSKVVKKNTTDINQRKFIDRVAYKRSLVASGKVSI